MSTSNSVPPRQRLFFGIVFAFCGSFPLFLMAGGLVSPAPRSADGPLWIAVLTSAIFLLAGAMLMLGALVPGATEDGSLPPDAPRAFRVAQYILGLGIAATLAVTVTWIACGPGERHFLVSGIGVGVGSGVWLGRAAFGVGAAVMWLIFVMMAVQGVRTLKEPGAPRGTSA
jgi:hypothetical protein